MTNKYKMDMKNTLLSYCQHSTIHGLYYVYRSNNWFGRTFWISSLLFLSIVAVDLSRQVWQEYSFDPLITAVENAYYPVKNIPFPSVVVCSNSLTHFDSPWARRAKQTIKSYGFKDEVLNEFFLSLPNPTLNITYEQDVVLIHQILYNVGLYKSYNEVLKNIRSPCNQLLLQCIWRSAPYDCAKMFYYVNTRSGFCCRFDENYLSMNVTETSQNKSIQDVSSLKLVLNGEYVTPDGESRDAVTRVYILSGKEHVTILHRAVQLAPGASYELSLRYHEIIASEYVKNLSQSFRKCILPEKDHMPYYKTCVTNNLVDYVTQHCKCFPLFITLRDSKINHLNCSWDQYRCIANKVGEFLSSSVQKNLIQDCKEQCEEVVYSPHIIHTKWSRKQTPKNKTSKDWFREHERYLEITVRFESVTCFRYIRQVIYTWEQMLANLGGLFSLSIGGSIISAIEIIWITATIIVSLVRNIQRKIRMKGTAQKEPKLAWENNELPAINGIPFQY